LRNISGLHIVRKRLKSGDVYYVYARRGGPLIHRQEGVRPAVTEPLLAKAQAAIGFVAPDALDRILDAYRASPEFASKAPATQREYRHRLNQISRQFGRVPTRLVHHPDFKAAVMRWRAEMAHTPRAADRAVGMLHTVLHWAKVNGFLTGDNPLAEIPKLHKANRANLIWEDRHWKAVEDCPGYIRRVLTLGSLTGLRISDLLRLAWEDVQDGYIALATGKSRGQTEAFVPLHEDLERFLTGPGRGPILRNSYGRPWTVDGWQSSWRKAQPEGFDRHVHDLRGTFATRLMIAGFSDVEIAAWMGWRAEQVAAIRARYVDRGRVARAMAERFKRP
jgi:integrase